MNDGNTVAGYFDPISSDTPKEHEPMNPTDMNEAEMREFFAKVASAVVNASEQAKVIEAIRAQQVEDHARLYNLESLVSTHLQTIDALREGLSIAINERNEARAEAITLRNERDVARDTVAKLESEVTNLLARNTERGATIHEHETTIHQLHTRIHELEAASKGAQQTIVDLQHTVYNAREEHRATLETLESVTLERDYHKTGNEAKAELIDHYETQLDQVRKAIS